MNRGVLFMVSPFHVEREREEIRRRVRGARLSSMTKRSVKAVVDKHKEKDL